MGGDVDIADSALDDLFADQADSDQAASDRADGEVSEGPGRAVGLATMPKIPKRAAAAARDSEGQLAAGSADEGSPAASAAAPDEPEDGEEPAGEQPVDPKQAELDEINRKIDEALKSGRSRRRKRTDEDDASIDEMIVELRKRMRDAAYRDIDDNKDHLPAIHKLTMLPKVVEELGKPHLYEAFLDNNIVDSIRLWLEPLDDGSLPSLDVQNAMLDSLKKLPIRRDHLRESGIGKIILFMSKCPRISETNRRACEQFIQQWSRMVLRLSADYHDRKTREATVDMDQRFYGSTRAAAPAAQESRQAPGTTRVNVGIGRGGESLMARIPARVTADYAVMPASSIAAADSPRQSSRASAERFKRLKQAMAKGKR
ncbi:Transcription factor iws1 [Coemansia biformis]|uniref:Transcription factor iws1 n=1 Tax=Coemansia biformis TaxID=1286918 RepID=A0A9W7YEJ2_9FUNG|nr:Transcription factor iws1 [Coemansia biformis]